MLTFYCNGIERNFIGSYVLIRFPSQNFNALVQLGRDQDPKRALQWTEQDTTVLSPIVYKRDVIQGSETVTLTGDSLPSYAGPQWDLGLDDYPFLSNGPRVVNAEITITPR